MLNLEPLQQKIHCQMNLTLELNVEHQETLNDILFYSVCALSVCVCLNTQHITEAIRLSFFQLASKISSSDEL